MMNTYFRCNVFHHICYFELLNQTSKRSLNLYARHANSHGSENIPVEKSSAPRFETWNGSRDPSETNLAWVDFLNIGQFCAIDHALFQRFRNFKIKITPLLIGIRSSVWVQSCSESSYLGGQSIIFKSTDIGLLSYVTTPFFTLAICNFLTRFEISRLLIVLSSSNIQNTEKYHIKWDRTWYALASNNYHTYFRICQLELNAHFGH